MSPVSISRLSRRDLLRLGAVAGGAVALPGLLSACGTSGSQVPIKSGPVHDNGYIEFFTAALPLAARKTGFEYTLDVSKIGATDIVTRMIAQAVTGTGTPDVVGLEVANFARTLRGDIAPELLVDLNEAVAPYRDDLIKARVDAFSKQGTLYALDSDTPMSIYYYRQDEFARLGVPDDIATWEEFAKVGGAITPRSKWRSAPSPSVATFRRSFRVTNSYSCSVAAPSSTATATSTSRRRRRRRRCASPSTGCAAGSSAPCPTTSGPACRER
jgi:Bacterial extracellular solute-binding protein